MKVTIEGIRVTLKLTREEMAEKMGINKDRYDRLAIGKSRMYATEFIRLHEISGFPYDDIIVEK